MGGGPRWLELRGTLCRGPTTGLCLRAVGASIAERPGALQSFAAFTTASPKLPKRCRTVCALASATACFKFACNAFHLLISVEILNPRCA